MTGNPMIMRLRVRAKVGVIKRCILVLVAQICLAAPLSAQQTRSAVEQADEVWATFVHSPQALADLSSAQQLEHLDQLGEALVEDPVSVGDLLEAEMGGRTALRVYVLAMLEDGRGEELAEHVLHVLHAGQRGRPIADVLNTADQQDGSTWFPLAEQAGFFLGGVAAVLDGKAETGGNPSIGFGWFGANETTRDLTLLAERLGMQPPAENQTAADWLLNGQTNLASALSRPAAQWFEKGFREAYR
ncbi:hypothetical protein FF80_01974 [Devosia sp. LC5]|nr:hypothetical protein FF80_01974 [Devosia sp. LC5]